jgi:ATP-dependent RNA helicase SUPV3L1/SUV3
MQMFCDMGRGGAWIRAIVGANADNIYLIGSPDATDSLVNLIEYIGDTYTVSTKHRRSKLNVLNKQVNYNDLQKGDAVVAFSKIDVLRYATILREKGFRVSTIYGNMPPEVKRSESNSFSLGKSDILVSTDAIGMGLNLPIKRIIFGAGKKYDGFEYRNLLSSEIKQIAGRAGRGSEDGFVGIIKERHNRGFSSSHIKKGLEENDYYVYSKFIVSPEIEIIKEISSIMNTNSLYLIYKFYLMIKSDGAFQPYIDSNILSKAKHLDKHFSDLNLKFKLSLVSFKGDLGEEFKALTNGKKHIVENNKMLNSFLDTPNDVEKLYHFLVLYKSLNRIDSDLWGTRIDMDVHIDDVVSDLEYISEHQYSNYFSKNIEECI